MSSPFFHADVSNKPRFRVLKSVTKIDFSFKNQSVRQVALKVVRSKRFQLGLLAIFLFFFGVGAVMSEGNMDFITASYLIAQVVTTIGYGDITPKSDVSKICVSIYCLLSLVIVAYVLNDFLAAMIELQEQYVSRAARSSGNCTSLRHDTLKNMLKSSLLFCAFLAFGTVFYRLQENCTCGYRGGSAKSQFVEGCDPTNYDTCVATGGITKTFIDTFYMSVITLTSVGFGDYRPDSQRGRIVAIFWMPTGVAVTGKWVSSVTAYLFERKRLEKEALQDKLSVEDLARTVASDEESKELTRGEHHLFWLVTKGIISQETLAEMDASYKERYGSRRNIRLSELSTSSICTRCDSEQNANDNAYDEVLATEPTEIIVCRM